VPIHCGALSAELLESELFGHLKGSFSGAHRDQPGLVEAANRGTLFLDEVGEMPPAMQVKLLRFLQDATFPPVGGRVTRRADVRLVAATPYCRSRSRAEQTATTYDGAPYGAIPSLTNPDPAPHRMSLV
jgi:transcriptional regulator with PAS, ATPase and Fis domain